MKKGVRIWQGRDPKGLGRDPGRAGGIEDQRNTIDIVGPDDQGGVEGSE